MAGLRGAKKYDGAPERSHSRTSQDVYVLGGIWPGA